MIRKTLKISVLWVWPWLLGAGLIWCVVAPVKGAESGHAEAAGLTVAEPVNLYDMTVLPRKIRKMIFRAAAYGKRGEYEKAVALLTKHLLEHPDQNHFLVELRLAQNLADLNRTPEARDHYQKAVEMEPRLDRGWFGLADASYALEDYETAAQAFVRGYETSLTKPVEVLSYAGTAFLMAGQPEAAFSYFAQLVSGRLGAPQLKWYRGLIVAAARMEEPSRADGAVGQMLATFPDDPEAWILSYQHKAGKRDFRDAAVDMSVAGYLRPLTANEEKQLGDLYLVAGVPYLASERYERSAGQDTSVAAAERLSGALVSAHETERALQVLQSALAKHETPRLWSLLGDTHYMRREYASARKAFAKIAESDATGRAWLMQGYCALEMGEKEAALDLLGRATSYPDQEDMAQMLLQRALKL